MYASREVLVLRGRLSPTSPIFPLYFQNRLHTNHLVSSGEGRWSGQFAIARCTKHVRATECYNNGGQPQLFPQRVSGPPAP